MSQKWIWAIVVIVVVVGLLWWAGVIPGVAAPTGSQGAAATSATSSGANAGATPSSASAVTLAGQASADLSAANTPAKLKAASTEVSAAVAALAKLLPQLTLAVNVSSNRGNDMSPATATLQDYATRLSALNSISVSAANAGSIAKSLTAIVGDISSINTALQAAKNK